MKFFRHLFVPYESNNQKAKLLHSESLIIITVFLVAFQLVLNFGSKRIPQVLGYAANISPGEVIRLTNIQRQDNGLSPLGESPILDAAALAKGNDMLAKGYWAHFAPDGTSPWSFFLKFGYKYQYAGENLARDFSDANSAVNAWMNSPSHKENILNAHYTDIGIGVVEGNLAGTDTTLIVQFFGSPLGSSTAISEVKAQTNYQQPTPSPIVKILPTPAPIVISVTPEPSILPSPSPAILSLVSPFTSTKSISLGVIGILLLVLSIDLALVRRKRIARIGGRTLAHIAYFGMILAVILILRAGQII